MTPLPKRRPRRSRAADSGPAGQPVLGSIRDIQRDNVQTFMDAWREYGDIVHFRGPLTINLLVHPDYVQHVLRDNYTELPAARLRVATSSRRSSATASSRAEGDQWATLAASSQPAFHPEMVRVLASVFTETTAEMLDEWEVPARAANRIDVKSEMMHISLANLGKALFQADWRQQRRPVEPIVAAYALAHTNRRLTSPVDPQRFPVPSTRAFNDGLASSTRSSTRRSPSGAGRRTASDRSRYPAPRRPRRGDRRRDDRRADPRRDDRLLHRGARDGLLGADLDVVPALARTPTRGGALHDEVDSVLGGPYADRRGRPEPAVHPARAPGGDAAVSADLRADALRAEEDDGSAATDVPAGANIVLCSVRHAPAHGLLGEPGGLRPRPLHAGARGGLHRMAYFPFAGGAAQVHRQHVRDGRRCRLVVAMVAQRFTARPRAGSSVIPSLRSRCGRATRC